MTKQKKPTKVKIKGETKKDKEIVELKDSDLQEVSGGAMTNFWQPPATMATAEPTLNTLTTNFWQYIK